MTVAGIGGDVVGAHDAYAIEGRRKMAGPCWGGIAFKGRGRGAGQGVEHQVLPGLGLDLVEEGPEGRAGQFHPAVHDRLDHLFQVVADGDGDRNPVEAVGPAHFFFGRGVERGIATTSK